MRGQVASLKAKKTAPSASKQSPPTAKTNEETPAKQNPNSNDHNKAQTATISANTINANNSPVADLPVKFLSLSSSQGIAADAPVVVANHHHPTAAATALGTTNNRMWKQNSGSSSGIPVGPITGQLLTQAGTNRSSVSVVGVFRFWCGACMSNLLLCLHVGQQACTHASYTHSCSHTHRSLQRRWSLYHSLG